MTRVTSTVRAGEFKIASPPPVARDVEKASPAQRAAGSSKGSTALTWIIAIGAGAVAVLAEPVIRTGLPTVLHPVWPLLTFGGGMLLSRRFGRSRPPAKAEPLQPASRIDRAAAELNLIAIDRSTVDAQGPAADVHDNVAVLSPAKARYLGVERAVQDLGHYETFTGILGKQMKSVADLSEEAAGSILTNLQGVDDKVSALLTFINRSGSSDQVVRVVEQIESDMGACGALIDAFVLGQKTNAGDSLKQRSQLIIDTKNVLDVLDGVKKVAQQTTILSLNVSIEAARVGEAGRGFTVIATEIRKLSAEVQALSSDVHTRVKGLMQTVTVDMQAQAKQREDVERVAIARISETLGSLTDNLTALVAHQRDVLQKVETESTAIARPIMDIMGSMQFQDIIRQQLEQLNRMAEMVGDHIGNLAAMLADDDLEMEDETLSQKLDGMFSSYVMARQRDTHMAAKGQAVTRDSAAKIELF